MQIALGDGTQLSPFLGARGRLAICDPEIEESGRHSETALKAMGLWEAVLGRLALSVSPNAEIQSVADGKVALAVGFDTDAVDRPGVVVVGEFPDGTHPPIVYPVAATTDSGQDALAFLAYVTSPDAAIAFPPVRLHIFAGCSAPIEHVLSSFRTRAARIGRSSATEPQRQSSIMF